MAQRVEGSPDWPTPKERSYLPEHQNGNHVSRPNSDETMNNTPKEEIRKLFYFFYLIKHSNSHKEASDPEERIDSKIGSWSQSGNTWCCEDIKTLCPVFDEGKSEPLIVTVDDPAN